MNQAQLSNFIQNNEAFEAQSTRMVGSLFAKASPKSSAAFNKFIERDEEESQRDYQQTEEALVISDRFEVSGKNIDIGNKDLASNQSISQKMQSNYIDRQGSFGGEFLRPRTPSTKLTDEAQMKAEFNFLKLQLDAMKQAILVQNNK